MKLAGARWHEFVLIEMTPEGRRGESAYTDLGRRKSYYTIKVVELDRGLLAAIETCTTRDGPAIRISEHDASNEA